MARLKTRVQFPEPTGQEARTNPYKLSSHFDTPTLSIHLGAHTYTKISVNKSEPLPSTSLYSSIWEAEAGRSPVLGELSPRYKLESMTTATATTTKKPSQTPQWERL